MRDLDRREFLAGVAGGVAAAAVPAGATTTIEEVAPKPVVPAPAGALAEPEFRPLPIGSIRPTGWLARQLRIQADGLTGHLDEFWPDVGQSQWFGGAAEGWERAPYWLDGAIPLAFILDDAPLKARIARYVDHIVTHQRADGWYAPYPADAATKRYDLWAILLANKALVQYHEATGDARVLEAVARSLRALLAGLDRTPLYEWGRFRWYEGLVSAFYVYERTREPWLLDLARKLRAQGVDFEALYRTDDITVPTPRRGLWKWTKHIVNTAMATKAAALSWRLDQRPSDRAFATRMLEILDRHHGQVTGVFSGDECLAGRSPLQGTELCSVVELHVLARAPLLRLRRRVLRGPARAGGLQCPAGHVRPGHVVAPVRPAGQPGAVHGEPRSPLHDQRPRVEHLRPRAELRLLHREHAPGLAEARRAPVDEDEGRGARGRGLGAQPRAPSPLTASPSPSRSTPTTRSARRSRSRSAPSGPCASLSSCACRSGRRARR